jgi:hypothetical protein
MLGQQVFDSTTTIYGNTFGGSIMTHVLAPYTYHAIQPSETYCPQCTAPAQHWFTAAGHIRVMPIRSNHAAHTRLLFFKIHLFKGKLRKQYFEKHFTSADSPTKAGRWREGCTYSFLVDFMERDTIAFRLFIQTSASDYPQGAPPAELMRERPVDLAILCAASTQNVKAYPQKILEHTGAKKLLIVHWEDFFQREPLNFKDPRLIHFTSYKKLAKRLAQWNPDVKGNVIMPRPGTMVNIVY